MLHSVCHDVITHSFSIAFSVTGTFTMTAFTGPSYRCPPQFLLRSAVMCRFGISFDRHGSSFRLHNRIYAPSIVFFAGNDACASLRCQQNMECRTGVSAYPVCVCKTGFVRNPQGPGCVRQAGLQNRRTSTFRRKPMYTFIVVYRCDRPYISWLIGYDHMNCLFQLRTK